MRRLAEAIFACVDGAPARAQVYRVFVAWVAEPGALERLWGVDRLLDREIVQWCRDHIPDPIPASALEPVVDDPHAVAWPCTAPTEVVR